VADPFPADALEANRAGRLSSQQRTWLRALAKDWRSNGRFVGGAIAVIGLLVLFLADKGGAERVLLGAGMVIVGGFFFVLSLVGADTMDADLRDGRVESVEGAIAKRTETTHGRQSTSHTYYLDVNYKSLRAFHDQYDAAPDAGYVRVYYVPHSMRVVNLERLPDRAGDAEAIKSPQDALRVAAKSIFSFDEVKSAEARAQIAAVGHALQAGPPPPAAERDPRPLAEAIVGKWSNGMLTITFDAGGTADMTLPGGMQRHAHWSVDAQGRLVADVMGESQAGEAWVSGDRLSITVGGEGIVLKRA
jgi:hypothetical protein